MAAKEETPETQTSSSVTHGGYHPALVSACGSVPSVNSTAVVEVLPNLFPVQFHTIGVNTDLKHLPSDWAKTKFQFYGLNNSHENTFSSFSSVNMAHNYKDLVGRVDVISSSKNIKDLLKMPYQQSPHISLMVHRLGKTLLLEEFDVHKNLIKKDAEEWQWLHDYFRRFMKKPEDKNSSWALRNSPKKDPLSDEMYRNLIRHSITASVANNACISLETASDVPQNMHPIDEESQDLKGFHHERLWKFHDRKLLVDSDLPIFGTDSKSPCISLRLRDSPPINVLTGLDYWLDNLMSNVPEVAMVYHINGFVQKYERVRTEDIPNLENSSFDSEEVKELARNILAFIKSRTVVEGHTYWLYKSENDDMVKLYDLTEYCKEELRIDDNPFTVPVGLLCYHVGRNLKMSGQRRSADCRAMFENCLRLLIEEKHPQICADTHYLLSDMWVPDKSLHDIWQGDGKIADPPDDLYDEDDNSTEDQESPHREAEEEGNLVSFQSMSVEDHRLSPQKSPRRRDNRNEVALQELVVRGMIKRRAWDVLKVCRIAGETDERCREALSHIRKGLTCIDKDFARLSRLDCRQRQTAFNVSRSNSMNNTTHQNHYPTAADLDFERENVRMVNPFVPIPLHYAPLKPDTKSAPSKEKETESKSNSSPSSDAPSQEAQGGSDGASATFNDYTDVNPWHAVLKFQLLRKAAIAFYILANQFHDSLEKRGHALRFVRYGLHCYECLSMQKHKQGPNALEDDVYFHLIYVAAKARSCLDPSIWASSRKDFEELSEEEAAILHSAQAILLNPKESWIYTWPENEEKNLTTACRLYKKIMKMKVFERKSSVMCDTIRKQQGICVLNLGNVVMAEMNDKIAKGEAFEAVERLMEKCKNSFEESHNIFMNLNDKNIAAYCARRIGLVYEVAARALECHTSEMDSPISKKEYQILQKMFDAYKKALSIYERDESVDDSRESVYHRMRDKYFNMATRYFKNMTVENIKVSKDLLQKSLNLCFLDPKSRHFKSSQRIGAICHYNLAVLYRKESQFATCDSPTYRSLRRKMFDHVQTAFGLYGNLKWCRSQVCVKAFLVEASMEYNEQRNSPVRSMKRGQRNILLHVCELQMTIDWIHTDQADKEDDSQEVATLLDAAKLVLDLINKNLQTWLKLFTKEEYKTPVYEGLKKLYFDFIQITRKKEVKFIAYPLSLLMTELKHFLSSDIFN